MECFLINKKKEVNNLNKRTKKIISCLIIIIILFLVMYIVNKIYEEVQREKLEQNLNDISWIRQNVDIINTSNYGDSVYSINYNKNINIYNLLYQQVISEKIDALLENDYTIKKPLIIYNPYGTNNLSANIYFETDKEMEISYNISVEDDQINDYANV